MGAVYLQPGVALLPLNDENRRAFETLAKDVRSWKGNASVLMISFTDRTDEEAVLRSFSAARTEEYQAIIADCGRLLAQLQWEKENSSKENGSYDESRYILEKNRLIRRLDTAMEHDFFQAEGREEAAAVLADLEKILPLRPQTTSSAAKNKNDKATSPKKSSNKRTSTDVIEVPAKESKESPEPEEEKREMPVFLF